MFNWFGILTLKKAGATCSSLTYGNVQQIKRAKQAVALLEKGMSLMHTAYEIRYTDQPHMTKSLKRLLGVKPTQIVRERQLRISGQRL